MPIDTDIEISPEVLEAPTTLDHRRDPCSLDDAYIFNFTNNPKAGKTAALRSAGYEGSYAPQEAHRVHNRLRPRIRQVMQEMVQDLSALANHQLLSILKSDADSVGHNCMLGAIKIGFETSGVVVAEQEEKVQRTYTDIQQRIEQLKDQIDQATGQRALTKPE